MQPVDRDEVAGVLRAAIVRADGTPPAQDIESAWELVDAGEPGVALETLCTQLYEYDVPVSTELAGLLADAGTRMGMDHTLWTDLTIRTTPGDTDGASSS